MPEPDPLAFGVDVNSVRDRVAGLGTFLLVGDIQTAEEALAGTLPFTPPAAFVSIVNEQAEPNRIAAGGFSQRVGVRLSVLFAIKAQRALDDVRDEMERTRKAIIRQLVAFVPEGAEKGLGYDRYVLKRIDAGLCWGEVLFLASYRFTQ